MRDYKKIKAYQLADELVMEVYKITKYFPKDETYGLVSQLRRAAVSIPTNIAEGASRQHKRDYLNFLFISRGSIAELEYLLQLANKLNYFKNSYFERINQIRKETARTLYGLIEAVKNELNK